MALFMTGSGLPRDRLQALAILSLVILAFSVAGMTIAPPPPSAFAMAASSLLTVVVVCVFFAWLGRHPRSA
jgi:VIT1/CCC1 family predicted Fe2+/Mn2+ transporter